MHFEKAKENEGAIPLAAILINAITGEAVLRGGQMKLKRIYEKYT